MSTFSRALVGLSALAFLNPANLQSQTINPLVNFGAVAVGATSASTIVTIAAPAGASFALTYGSEFVVAPASCSQGSCAVPVTFQPTYPGPRKGALSAYNGSTLLSVTPLLGTATAPQLTLGPGLMTTIASTTNGQLATATIAGVAARDSNVLYLSDSRNHEVFSLDKRTGQLTLVAGNGTPSFSGDGGAAVSATLSSPSALAIDYAGNLLIADTANNRIRKVDANGIITTVAGNGAQTFGGDGGPALSASFNAPAGLAVALNGDIFVADTVNCRVRQISLATGTVNTVAGNGACTYGGDNGSATAAQLNFPIGIAVDASNNVFIADSQNFVIRKVSGGTISTVVGQPTVQGFSPDGTSATTALLNYPDGLVVDAAGDLYISDVRNNVIRKVTGDVSHVILTIAGSNTAGYIGDGGSALSSRIYAPSYLSMDNLGNLLFIDTGNNALRSVSAAPSPVTFPYTTVGTQSNATVTISNTGTSTLNVSAVALSSGFSDSGGTCGSSPTLAAGQYCTAVLAFLPAANSATTGTISLTSNTLNSVSATPPLFLSQSNGLYFVPTTPCRVVDTRNAGTFASGYLAANTTRTIAIRSSPCGGSIPMDVQAYALNATVVPHASLNFLTVAPSISGTPTFSTLNARDGRTKANAVIVPANLTNGSSVDVFSTDDTELVLDIFGYYVPQTDAGALAYYPLPPCRVADTRFNSGGILAANETRNFPISGTCSVPGNAQAYSLNFTALPLGSIPGTGTGAPLPYLTAWPAGAASQPVVSTLNATTGTVTANAAIIPAGSSGNISVFVKSSTHVIIDVSGYYAPAGAGGLALYNTAPCRAYDSRFVNSPGGSAPPINGVFSTDVRTPCAFPSTAQSIVLNATVVPTTSLIYLTLWAHGSAEPLQSTLNAYDAAVTSNLAVVPTVDGLISSYTAAPSGLIYDLFGYFAP